MLAQTPAAFNNEMDFSETLFNVFSRGGGDIPGIQPRTLKPRSERGKLIGKMEFLLVVGN